MKLLLLGPNGQLGWELRRALAPLGDVTALGRDGGSAGRSGDDRVGTDFTDADALAAAVRHVRPDVIVNAAAYTAVDRAESEPDLAHRINAVAPGRLAHEAAALGAWLLHYSTDYVFDGSGTTARTEDAATAPLNLYGHSKLAGEEAIRASGCRHLIFRTSWLYAARGNNFAKTMLRLAGERDALNVIDDQIGAPTGADLLADVTAHALRTVQTRPELSGTYHAAAAGETSWHGYASHVIHWARAHGSAIRVDTGALRPVPTSAYPTAARRPLNSRLDCTRLQATFGLTLPPWHAGVERLLAEILPG